MRSVVVAVAVLLSAVITLVAAQDVERITSGQIISETIVANTWKYYALDVTSASAELNVAMSQTSIQGDPDLYIRRNTLPTLSEFDRHDVTSAVNHSIRILTTDDASTFPLQPGLYYIAVYGFGNANSAFTLIPQLWACPGDCFASQSHGTCNPTNHVCTCTGEWATNQLDCSASLAVVKTGDKVEGTIDSELSRYYNFTITDPNIYEIIINVARTGGLGQPTLLLGLNRYPTLASSDGPPIDSTLPYPSYQIHLVKLGGQLQGRWTFAILNSAHAVFSYSFIVIGNECPLQCSGHGTCNMATHICKCDKGWEGTMDCSLDNTPLEAGEYQTRQIKAFDKLFYEVGVPTHVNTRRIELRVQVVKHTAGDFFPRIYMQPDDYPTNTKFWSASRLPESALSEVRIPSGDFGDLGEAVWFILVENRYADPMNVTVALDFIAHCVSGIADEFGACECDEGWSGEDCSLAPEVGKVHVGVAIAIIFALFFVGMFLGFCLKRCRPGCCGAKRPDEIDMQATSDLGYALAPGAASA